VCRAPPAPGMYQIPAAGRGAGGALSARAGIVISRGPMSPPPGRQAGRADAASRARSCAWRCPAAAAPLLAACGGVQSTLQPSGPAARAIADLWWVLFAVSALVFLIVCGLLALALLRRREAGGGAGGSSPPLPTAPGAERPQGQEQAPPRAVLLGTAAADRRAVRWVLGGGVLASGVVLTGTLIVTLRTLGLLSAPDRPADLTIEVVGWQWWWEVRYLDPAGRERFETANEIHIPVGQRVRVRLKSADVIHSFWVPRLAGKLDMIPGRTTQFWVQADEPGIFRGQCAEYCAGPHALMAFHVVAEPEAEFRAWAARQAQGEARATDSLAVRGRRVFLGSACAACHAVRGTPAVGNTGPDLTHVAGRLTLAAGTTPNTPGYLAGWISNPQQIKPGNHMPAVPLGAEAFIALLRYLQTLK
jgi:cytochrome c oxidase subunit 2